MPPTADAAPAGDASPPAPAAGRAGVAAAGVAPAAEGSGDGPAANAVAKQSAGELLPLVYEQLRRLARQRMADERSRHTLQPTALVHEAYLRLEEAGVKFAGKGHFLRVAAKAMQRILIEHARARGRAKRGGGAAAVPASVLDLVAAADAGDADRVLAFDDALRRLEAEAPLAAQVVRLRFYAGLTVPEVAEAERVSPRTVDREWVFARAWLFRVLSEDLGPG